MKYRLKRFLTVFLATCVCMGSEAIAARDGEAVKLSKSLTFFPGPVNGALIETDVVNVYVYGDPSSGGKGNDNSNVVLFTHHRRDVVWAGRRLVEAGGFAFVPKKEREYFEDPAGKWEEFVKIRLKDTQQQSTKMLARPLAVGSDVEEGTRFEFGSPNRRQKFEVIDTPGFTRGSVSYIATIDGKKVAFTGDLIYGDGQILDLYSFQDKIPEAKIGGYHGYGARLAPLLDSLRKVAALKPDLIVPARGPIIRNPQASIEKLIGRVQELYRNYLSTNALYWYFKADRMKACAERILGTDAEYELMPYSHHEEMPGWVIATGTTRILVSEDGAGFMLDCGSKRYIDFVKKLMADGLITKIEGIFVTHYHGDHTDWVQAAAEEFKCPVYSTTEYEDILEHPEAYHMAAMTPNAIKDVTGLKDGTVMKWRDLELTFYFYPGQALYHGGLLVKKPGDKTIFFIGDAFTPSGMDDYCTLNRNLVREDNGYLYCFKKLRELKGEVWLMNEHVTFIFKYTPAQLDYLESRYRERIRMLGELFPWDDPNYGVDEQWAWFYPYGAGTVRGKTLSYEFRIWNHSSRERTYAIQCNLPEGMIQLDYALNVTVAAGARKNVPLKIYVSKKAIPGNNIVTADVFSEGMAFREWAETIVTVAE